MSWECRADAPLHDFNHFFEMLQGEDVVFESDSETGQPVELGRGATGQVRAVMHALVPIQAAFLVYFARGTLCLLISLPGSHASQMHQRDTTCLDLADRMRTSQQVLLAHWKSRLVAVKILRDDNAMDTSFAGLEEDFRQESQMLQDMHHPFILKFLGARLDSKPVRS